MGYTLEGIKSPEMDAFIEGMRSPAETRILGVRDARTRVLRRVRGLPLRFLRRGGAGARRGQDLVADFPSSPVHSVTLSTMHGCPPEEIERIGAYLIEDKGFDTFVKLNPTLLGFDAARRILDETGWKAIEIGRDNFERDLQFPDALGLIASLDAAAESRGRNFGIKLSNTLANANTGAPSPAASATCRAGPSFP